MSQPYLSLDQQIANAEANIHLIEERKSEYVEATAIPLDLIKDERVQRARLQELLILREQLRSVDCPYRGLEMFREEHAVHFHGRTVMVEQLVSKLRLANFIAVIGVSGSGKSSLVRAGLIPALRNRASPGSPTWQIAVFRPGADPLTSLCASLVNLLSPDLAESAAMAETRHLADDILTGKLVMSRDILPRLAQQSASPQCLVVIDQFEEIFDPQVDARIREQFIQAITDTGAADWLRIVVTLRANYFDAALQQPRLREKVAAGQFTVLPMNEAERRDAIMLPVINTGRSFEPGLVDRVLEDLSAAAGELPLLEFAMTQLWQRQTPAGVLTHAAYEEIGAVGGAIARHASEIFFSVSPDQQRQIQQLCTRLVRIDADEAQAERLIAEATIRRVSLDDLAPATQELIHDVLATQRLVIVGRNESTNSETVELVHEALIRSWPQLSQWLVEDAPNLRMQQSLTEAVQIWERFDRSLELLYSGRRLQELLDWQQTQQPTLTARETEFLRVSVAARTRQRWLMAAGALALLIVIGGLATGVVIGFLPRQPAAMPPNHFNIAVTDFTVAAPPGTDAATGAILERDAASFASQLTEDLQAMTTTLATAVFNDDVTIWGPEQFTIASSQPISVLQSMRAKNVNVLLIAQLAPAAGRYWFVQPIFFVNDALFSDRVGEMLDKDASSLGAQISYIPGNQQSIQTTEQELRARLTTLGQFLRGLTQYDLGSEAGYRAARTAFCTEDMLHPDVVQGPGEYMRLLFCGHANNMLANMLGPLHADYSALMAESEAAYRAGLAIAPDKPRLQISLASILLTLGAPLDDACTGGADALLIEAIALAESVLTKSDKMDALPLSARIETNWMVAQASFWRGLCFDQANRDSDWSQAEASFDAALTLQQNAAPADRSTRFVLRAVGASEFHHGFFLAKQLTLAGSGPSADQLRIDATGAYSNSVAYYLAIGDEEATTYAASATVYALYLLCGSGHSDIATAFLNHGMTQAVDPQQFREKVFTYVPPAMAKGCGL